jgi:hydroxymethylpyrimidine pyrophosphatase-like HAD family hydrolase
MGDNIVTFQQNAVRLIAIDMDGTLLGLDGQVSPRNLAALRAAESAGIEIVIATGRRHSYAMRVLRSLELRHANALISSNGAVTRTIGSCVPGQPIASQLLNRALLPHATSSWLLGHLSGQGDRNFRNALVLTFDRVGPDGEDTRGALVVEHLDELHSSIGRWMQANEPYIAQIVPLESALTADDTSPEAPIQMMLCGTIARMARAEGCLLEHPGISASGHQPRHSGAPSMAASSPWAGRTNSEPLLTLHRTEYPGRDLSILDILPAGCSKGAALLRLAETRGLHPSQILAVGDNWNDVSMLEIAGRAVLMANAPDDLKAHAVEREWTIGCSNDLDGVAEAIQSAVEATLTTAC